MNFKDSTLLRQAAFGRDWIEVRSDNAIAVDNPATGEVISGSLCSTPPCPVDNAMHIRSSVGVGLIWDSPFGLLRFDYSFPLS